MERWVGWTLTEICRELGISTATFYKWRAKFGGMDTSMMTRMKELEDENRRLKKMYLEEKLKVSVQPTHLSIPAEMGYWCPRQSAQTHVHFDFF